MFANVRRCGEERSRYLESYGHGSETRRIDFQYLPEPGIGGAGEKNLKR